MQPTNPLMEGQTLLNKYFNDWYYFWLNTKYTRQLFLNRLNKLKKNKCSICNKKCKTHIHHVISLSEGGSWYKDNIIEVCLKCHTKLHKYKIGYLNAKLKKEK